MKFQRRPKGRRRRFGHRAWLVLCLAPLLLFSSSTVETKGVVGLQTMESAFYSFFIREDPTEYDMWESKVIAGPNGALHAAFSGDVLGGHGANYAYCPGECANRSNWTVVRVGTVGGSTTRGSATITLTPDGRPRMMWFTTDVASTSYWGAYKYAECDANCTNAANWRVSEDIPSGTLGEPHSVHYFDVDSQGRPRFVVYGDVFVMCNNDCMQLSNWQSYKYTSLLGLSGMADPYFLIGNDDRPRMISMKATGTLLYYWECTTSCASQSDWTYTALVEVGAMSATNAWGFALDAAGRPRIALYIGSGLYYLWCDGNPTSASNWYGYRLLPEGYGHKFGGVDLTIDGNGIPHIVHALDPYANPDIEDYGLGYARCLSDCHSGDATWGAGIVETTAILDQVEPIPVNSVDGCTTSFWEYAGMWPAVAVDQNGEVIITHYTHHLQHAIDNPQCNALIDRQSIRVAATGPAAPTPIAVTDVAIGGPASCALGSACTFTAAVSPTNAAAPITYTWTATEQPQQVRVDNNSATFTWMTAGNKTIGIQVQNATGNATATIQVVVTQANTRALYLPLVVR